MPAAGSIQAGRRRSMRAYCAPAMRVTVLTTSYPRHEGDVAGAFVENAVQNLRSAGVEIDVVSPAGFRDFGIAYGDGIAANLTSNPARAALLPAFFASYALRSAAGSSERGSRPCPLVALRPTGARHREAVRAPGLGN